MSTPTSDMQEKAKKALEEVNRMLDLFNVDYPEPKCSICGRIIYCGASTLCKEEPCGLR